MKTRACLFGGSWMRDARSDSHTAGEMGKKAETFSRKLSKSLLLAGTIMDCQLIYYDTSVVELLFRFEKLT